MVYVSCHPGTHIFSFVTVTITPITTVLPKNITRYVTFIRLSVCICPFPLIWIQSAVCVTSVKLFMTTSLEASDLTWMSHGAIRL